MEVLFSLIAMLAILFTLLGLGVWVAVSIFVAALIGLQVFTSVPALVVLPRVVWGSLDSFVLTALPLFIFMGELLIRTRLSNQMFNGLAPWLGFLPGKLLHVNVVASTIFAAISGSSVATAATIGKINIPQLRDRGYEERLVLGSLAGAGTLGFLIPPSIVMIIYGVLAEVSIGRLFIAGVIPGLLLGTLFMTYIAVASVIWPEVVPSAKESYTWRARFIGLAQLLPSGLLILAVLGSIYLGYATPTESAAIGVTGAALIALAYRTLSWSGFLQAVRGTIQTTCMIGFIIAGAALFSTTMGYVGLPRLMTEWVGGQEMSRYLLIAGMVVAYLMLGMFLEGSSMLLITLPIVLPMIIAAGFDPLWFGIFLVLLIEAAQITPPVGFNLFVLQEISGRPIGVVAIAAVPFFLCILGLVVLITIFPQVVSFLPSLMVR